jgi:hypothetical protein
MKKINFQRRVIFPPFRRLPFGGQHNLLHLQLLSMNRKAFFILLCTVLGAAIGYSVDLSSESSPGAWFVTFSIIGLSGGLLMGMRKPWQQAKKPIEGQNS